MLPVSLLVVEVWVLLMRFDLAHADTVGYSMAITALVPWLLGVFLASEAGRGMKKSGFSRG